MGTCMLAVPFMLQPGRMDCLPQGVRVLCRGSDADPEDSKAGHLEHAAQGACKAPKLPSPVETLQSPPKT